jgi:hypothetical protein
MIREKMIETMHGFGAFLVSFLGNWKAYQGPS